MRGLTERRAPAETAGKSTQGRHGPELRQPRQAHVVPGLRRLRRPGRPQTGAGATGDLAPRGLIVSGIGCGSKIVDYMRVNGFMTLHGRPLAVATASSWPTRPCT